MIENNKLLIFNFLHIFMMTFTTITLTTEGLCSPFEMDVGPFLKFPFFSTLHILL